MPTPSPIRGNLSSRIYETAQILQWHVLLRIVVSFFILFSTIAFHFSDNLSVFYGLIGANVLMTLLSAFCIGKFYDNNYFIWSQVIWDILFVTTLVYISGGINSLFTFMYILSVINTSILMGSFATVLCAGIYFLGYLSIVIGQQLGYLHPLSLDATAEYVVLNNSDLIFKILLNGAAMIIAAWLASKVAENAKQINSTLRQKQSALEELKALNEHIVQSINVGLLSLTPDGIITFANHSAGRLLAVNVIPYIGQHVTVLFPDLDVSEKFTNLPQELVFEAGEDIRHMSGLSSILTNDDGENIGWIVSFRDITRLKKMEEEVKRADRLAAVGKMAAGIAHEIRNPLASMSGSIQLLSNELDLEPENKQLMQIVLRETDRLNMLITDFLMFARPPQMNPIPLSIGKLLIETVDILQNDPMCNNVVIEKAIPLAPRVVADPDQLRQVFWNLLTNAVQSMPSGGKLTLTSEWTRGGPWEIYEYGALVAISDTGMGMKEEVKDNVFDPFFTAKPKGSGLGLTTAYRIVEKHNGRIWCESEVDVGTTFYVFIPARGAGESEDET